MDEKILNKTYKAFVVEETEGGFVRSIQTKRVADLPDNGVLIRVQYSSLNYKDALSASGNKGVTKNYPHTPGIDAAGVVEYSNDPSFAVGDEVVVTGNDLGMNTPGGYGQYINVPAEWVVKLPEGLTLKESMIIGTAGFTAAILVQNIVEKVSSEDGEIVVTGATGGVGTLSVALLAKLGYEVIAVSGKESEKNFLLELGAKEVIGRDGLQDKEARPMLSAKYAGVVDTVGGTMLENMIKLTKPFGVVTCCGNVSSPKLDLTVFPFILRGVSLVGVSSQNTRYAVRQNIWKKLAAEWKLSSLLDVYTEIKLEDLDEAINLILQGKIKGRTVVDMQ